MTTNTSPIPKKVIGIIAYLYSEYKYFVKDLKIDPDFGDCEYRLIQQPRDLDGILLDDIIKAPGAFMMKGNPDVLEQYARNWCLTPAPPQPSQSAAK